VKRLRWGLLGTARINRAIIPALRVSERSELAAVASRQPDKGAAYAREWGIPRVLGYEEMLADAGIDVIYIPLPNSLHAEWTIRAARAGKHVLCEKPLALSVEEVDAVAAAARAAGVVVAEAFMYRHHPQTRRLKELVESGAVGPVKLVRSAFTFDLTREADVRLASALGGGSLWDVGCYPVSIARHLLGVEPVEAFGWQAVGQTGIDEGFYGQLRFGPDVFAQFDSGFRAAFRTRLEVVGRAGTLVVPRPFKPTPQEAILLTRGDKTEEIAVGGPSELYLGEVEDMADAVLLGRAPAVSLAESRGNVAALVALYASARAARPVAVAGSRG
jgi:D-xylose 1-dehydrogenase (NADP+, D-xylono-1,5-lactone-forming)